MTDSGLLCWIIIRIPSNKRRFRGCIITATLSFRAKTRNPSSLLLQTPPLPLPLPLPVFIFLDSRSLFVYIRHTKKVIPSPWDKGWFSLCTQGLDAEVVSLVVSATCLPKPCLPDRQARRRQAQRLPESSGWSLSRGTRDNAIPPCGTGATCLSRAVMYIFKGSIFLSKQLGRLIEYGLHNIVSVPLGLIYG